MGKSCRAAAGKRAGIQESMCYALLTGGKVMRIFWIVGFTQRLEETAMKYRQVVAAIVLTTFGWGGVARGDDLTDEMTSNPAMMTTIRSLGVMACLGQEGAKDAAADKAELRKNFWAFSAGRETQ